MPRLLFLQVLAAGAPIGHFNPDDLIERPILDLEDGQDGVSAK